MFYTRIILIGMMFGGAALQAEESNPLLGCWQCDSGKTTMSLRFETAHYVIEGEPLAYRLVPGYIQIPEPDGYSRYPYRIENGKLTIHMDDTPPLNCQRSSCPAAR